MHLATQPSGFHYRERLTRTRQQPGSKTIMSAKALAACRLEPAAEQTVASDHQAPETLAAEIRFREELSREYQIEAINAGFSAAQAIEYASALSSGMGRVVSASEMAPVGRSWFYRSQPRVVRRTITSWLSTLTRRERSKFAGPTAVAGASSLAREFRWWHTREKR
jgi:hypothetical protein